MPDSLFFAVIFPDPADRIEKTSANLEILAARFSATPYFPELFTDTGGEGFAYDSILRHTVCTPENYFPYPHKSVQNRRQMPNSFGKTDPRECLADRQRLQFRWFSPIGRVAVRFQNSACKNIRPFGGK
jgi:hypothetical protein